MKCLQPVKLSATAGTQGTWTVPATAVRLDLINLSNWPIRYAFVTSKVNAVPLSFPYEYETLPPMQPGAGQSEPHTIGSGGGTLYYTSNGLNAPFLAIAYKH